MIDGARMVVENWRPQIKVDQAWPMVQVGNLITTVTPPAKIPAFEYTRDGTYPIVDQSQSPIAGYTDDQSILVACDSPLIVFGDHTCAVKLQRKPFAQGADGIKILRTNGKVTPEYLYAALNAFPVERLGYRRHFALLKEHTVPLPPLEQQREVAQRVLDEEAAVEVNRELIGRMETRVQEVVGRVWG